MSQLTSAEKDRLEKSGFKQVFSPHDSTGEYWYDKTKSIIKLGDAELIATCHARIDIVKNMYEISSFSLWYDGLSDRDGLFYFGGWLYTCFADGHIENNPSKGFFKDCIIATEFAVAGILKKYLGDCDSLEDMINRANKGLSAIKDYLNNEVFADEEISFNEDLNDREEATSEDWIKYLEEEGFVFDRGSYQWDAPTNNLPENSREYAGIPNQYKPWFASKWNEKLETLHVFIPFKRDIKTPFDFDLINVTISRPRLTEDDSEYRDDAADAFTLPHPTFPSKTDDFYLLRHNEDMILNYDSTKEDFENFKKDWTKYKETFIDRINEFKNKLSDEEIEFVENLSLLEAIKKLRALDEKWTEDQVLHFDLFAPHTREEIREYSEQLAEYDLKEALSALRHDDEEYEDIAEEENLDGDDEIEAEDVESEEKIEKENDRLADQTYSLTEAPTLDSAKEETNIRWNFTFGFEKLKALLEKAKENLDDEEVIKQVRDASNMFATDLNKDIMRKPYNEKVGNALKNKYLEISSLLNEFADLLKDSEVKNDIIDNAHSIEVNYNNIKIEENITESIEDLTEDFYFGGPDWYYHDDNPYHHEY